MRKVAAVITAALLGLTLAVPALGNATVEPGPCPDTFTKSDPPVDVSAEWGTATVGADHVTFLVAAGYTVEVCVKGGPDHTLETLVGMVNHTVYTPTNPNNNQPYGLSHFGFRIVQTPPTTSTPDTTEPEDTTTTTGGTSSTTITTPPTTAPATSSTTTTPSPTTSTTTSSSSVPSSTAPTTTTPSVTSPPSTTPSELPRTGISSGTLLAIGLGLLGSGIALSWLSKETREG